MATAPCPNCKTPMSWSSVNNQWYCPKCEIFHQAGPVQGTSAGDHFVEEVNDILGRSNKPKQQVNYCPSCNTPLNWIAQYQKWYCYTCRQYR